MDSELEYGGWSVCKGEARGIVILGSCFGEWGFYGFYKFVVVLNKCFFKGYFLEILVFSKLR